MLSIKVIQLFKLIVFSLTLYLIFLDPDEYLHNASQAWCQLQLENISIMGPITTSMQCDDGIPIHKVAYLYLREMGNHFITHGGNLALSTKPTGTYGLETLVDLQQETPQEINLQLINSWVKWTWYIVHKTQMRRESVHLQGCNLCKAANHTIATKYFFLSVTKMFYFQVFIFCFSFVVDSYLFMFT